MQTPEQNPQSKSSNAQPPELPKATPIETPKRKKSPILAIALISCAVLFIGFFGLVALIAIPNIGKINEAAKEAKNMRNAQSLASVYAASYAAGLDFTNQEGDVEQIVDDLVVGKTSQSGPFQGSFFGMPDFTEEDKKGAIPYLAYSDGLLVFMDERARMNNQKVEEIRVKVAEAKAAAATKQASVPIVSTQVPVVPQEDAIEVSIKKEPKLVAVPKKSPTVIEDLAKEVSIGKFISASEQRNRANARQLASIYGAAKTAGADLPAESLDEAIVYLVEGSEVALDLGFSDIREAMEYLKFEQGDLLYKE